ncbi:MAG: glucose-methanol-choline oxidoreductase [Rhodocyclaceae bacterium]|nr:MAG: glucose-methanol-choline oxidoreductase [Rhodocyclaceae bacterium]TND02798.1 MAG: glucose-methanol-choline oxidoreductase [Rhodocyclaceae bacterium]
MIKDPFTEGLAKGWKVVDAARLATDREDEADVVIVGSGAGGGIAAEILAKSGLRVVVVEEGPLRSTSDFHMRESEAYPALYQESAARKTADKGINILQGRCVGGSTTVNWTSSFRTPPGTLKFWQGLGLADYTQEALLPWFEMVERRLSISAWYVPPNANNEILRTGASKLGIEAQVIRRNVNGCWNLGYCGTGCPTNAKQSMLITTLPAALELGATIYYGLRAERLNLAGDKVTGLDCVAVDAAGIHPQARRVRLRAKHFVLAGGAIGSPALLLRSGAPDASGQLGRRTFLHPTLVSSALMDTPVDGHAGAPQSLYSDHFLDNLPIDGPLGYKLEAPPLHPVLFATTLQGFGEGHAALMKQFRNAQVLLALLRDGFNPASRGGRVRLREDGTPLLDYPLDDVVWDGARRALLTMAEIQFAAGAKKVYAVHEECAGWDSWAAAKEGIARLPMKPLAMRVVSAHVMGGCAMGKDAGKSVVDPRGRHHQLGNLTVADGSLFPTSIGANPQQSVYGIVARNISALAQALTGKPAASLA